MKTFILISWRNLWRNKRRSLVVIYSIAIGIFLMIFTMGFMNGMNVQMVENTISTSLSHVAIHKKGFQDNMKLDYNFTPTDKINKIIRQHKSTVAISSRVKVQGMIRSSEASRGVLIVGIDPANEKKISKIYDYTSKKDGSMFLDDPMEDAILISVSMAKKLDLQVGDKLVMMIQDKKKEIIGTGMIVKGLFKTPIESFDKFIVFTGLQKLQEITGLNNNLSEISILLSNKNQVDSVKEYLIKNINDKNLEILSWKDMAPNLVKAIDLFDMMMLIFFAIIFITVIFSVANTLIMAIMERFHEIGVMKSIGTRPSWISFMVIFEAINLGLVGLGVGIAGGMLLVTILSITGIDFSFFMESMRTWGTGSIIYPTIRMYDIMMAFVIVLFTTIIAAIYPAIKAARIKPLEALHYI